MVDEFVIAYHEAGHAVLAEAFGGHVLFVTIEPVEDDGPRRHGETKIAWRSGESSEQRKSLAAAQVKVALAGPVSEMIYCDEQYEIEILREWWADWLLATHAITTLHRGIKDADVHRILQREMQQLIEWISQDQVWHKIASLADELVAHQTLEADQLDELRRCGLL